MGKIDTIYPRSEWKWFGSVGHFICGRWCRFHLATQVGIWFISTVGEYVHPRHSEGSERKESEWLKENWPGEDIGCDRKYETMVFTAGLPCTREGCNCGMPLPDDYTEIDANGYNTAGDATAGHMKMCEKYAMIAEKRRLEKV